VAVAVAAAGLVFAYKAVQPSQIPANQVTDPRYGWTATVPPGWIAVDYREPYVEPSGASPVPGANTGLAFANFDLGGAAAMDYVDGAKAIPPDGSLLLVAGVEGYPHISEHGNEMFPVQLMDGSGEFPRQGGFIANGVQFSIYALEGSDVSEQTKSDVDRIAASISFPSPPEPAGGQAVEIESGVLLLGPPDRYPLRSLTPVVVNGGEHDGLALVIVHAPDGFYALQPHWSDACPFEYHRPRDRSPRARPMRTQDRGTSSGRRAAGVTEGPALCFPCTWGSTSTVS